MQQILKLRLFNMTYELAKKILPFCKNCVEEIEVHLVPYEGYFKRKTDECIFLSFSSSNLIYKKVSLFNLCLMFVKIL